MSVGHGIPLASVGLLTPLSVGIVLNPRKVMIIKTVKVRKFQNKNMMSSHCPKHIKWSNSV